MIITLLTDFGTADSYVGEVKGVLLSGASGATLVDLTHEIAPGDIPSAAYILNRCRTRFPAGTVHLAVVDPGVGTERPALAIAAHGQFFVGPDNGLFTYLLRDAVVSIVRLPEPPAAAATFHGRDLFAPAAAALAAGMPLDRLGPPLVQLPHLLAVPEPWFEPGRTVGSVVHCDRFGNLVTNIPVGAVGPASHLLVGDLDLGPLRRAFADVPAGSLLGYLGSDGTVEIAVHGGSAAARLGLGVGGSVELREE
jgi:S-adenosylmethionine hydrolase